MKQETLFTREDAGRDGLWAFYKRGKGYGFRFTPRINSDWFKASRSFSTRKSFLNYLEYSKKDFEYSISINPMWYNPGQQYYFLLDMLNYLENGTTN